MKDGITKKLTPKIKRETIRACEGEVVLAFEEFRDSEKSISNGKNK